MPVPRLALLVICLVISSASAAVPQERYGGITGVVKDQTGGLLPGVTVTLTEQTSGRAVVTVSDGEGMYRARELEPGRYRITFALTGFASLEHTGVVILLGRTLELDVTLALSGVIETVQVATGASPLIDVRTSTAAHDVAAEEFDLLPKTRAFVSLATTAPAVNAGEIEGGLQVNGGSSAENAFTIDGVTINSLIHARARQNAAFEYLQEVQVKTTGIAAEYGGALGGVISAVTRSGSNQFRGEAHYFYEGSALAASPVPRLVLNPLDDRSVSYVQDAKGADARHEIGGSLGGPIARDRVFFFVSASPQFLRRENPYYFGGGDRGAITQRRTAHQVFGKISVAAGKTNAHATVLHTPTRSAGTLPAYDGAGANRVVSSRAANAVNDRRGFDVAATSASGNLDLMISGSSLLTMRGGLFRDDYADTGIPTITSVTYQTSNVGMGGVAAEWQGPTGTSNTPRAMIVAHDTTTRAFGAIDYTRMFAAGGRHQLKGGAQVQWTANDVEASYPGGYVFVYWDRTFSFGGTTGRGSYGYYEVHDRGIRGRASAPMVAMYVQDEWRAGSRLTFNLGVRAENERLPTYRPDLKRYGVRFGFADRVAPRLGLAFDARGDGRLKLFASWGRYYDWTKYELPRDSFGADFWTIRYRALETPDVWGLSLDNTPGRDLWIIPGAVRDQRVPNFDNVDPDLDPTWQDSASAGVEYQIAPATVVTARYVHNDLQQVIDDIGTLIDGNTVLMIANPGSGRARTMPTSGLTAPFPTPPVQRRYDGLDVGITRRLANRWFGGANYTWSRLYGNYGGLASADEIRTPTTGASFKTHQQQSGSIANPGGSVNNAWNLDQVVWDAHGRLDVVGRLATDRPHVLKLYGGGTIAAGTDAGLSILAASGTPISTYVNTTAQAEVFVDGRGDMGRTPALTQVDAMVARQFAVRGRGRLRLQLTVLNLFNQKTARHIFNWLNRGAGIARASSAIDLSRTDLAKGYDYEALIRATPDGVNAFDPRYGMADLFNEGRQAQIMVRLTF